MTARQMLSETLQTIGLLSLLAVFAVTLGWIVIAVWNYFSGMLYWAVMP